MRVESIIGQRTGEGLVGFFLHAQGHVQGKGVEEVHKGILGQGAAYHVLQYF
jgi:hypothetical protein